MLTPATEADVPALDALFSAAFADYAAAMGQTAPVDRTPWIAGALRDGGAFWIGNRIGAVLLSRTGTTIKIESIGIHPDRQGHGNGRKALDAVESHARADGATEIALHTGQQFHRLVAFYSGAGYRVTAVGPHPKGRDDRLRVFMMKSLL